MLGRSRCLFKESGKTRLASAMNIISALTIILINILQAACRFSAAAYVFLVAHKYVYVRDYLHTRCHS